MNPGNQTRIFLVLLFGRVASLFSSCKIKYPAIVYSTLQEERDRQITAMKERVARVKYERTQTMKERGATTSRQFDELVSDAGAGITFLRVKFVVTSYIKNIPFYHFRRV